jgi:hypothetical protein
VPIKGIPCRWTWRLDKKLWEHFGSEERVLEALRMLVSLAERSSRSVA